MVSEIILALLPIQLLYAEHISLIRNDPVELKTKQMNNYDKKSLKENYFKVEK